MTFAEVELACNGYEIRTARLKEVPRIIAGMIANVYKSGKQPVNIERYIPLYTDKLRKGVDKIGKDEYADLLKQFGRELPTAEQRERLINRTKWQSTTSKR